jgi:hypothetical protein
MPFSVIKEQVVVGGFTCGASGDQVPPLPGSSDVDDAYTFRPDAPGKFPLISYAHSLEAGKDLIPKLSS